MNEYLKAFLEPPNSGAMYISLAGLTYPDSSYRITRPHSDNAVIEYILSGDGYVVINGKTNHVEKDRIYFLHQGEDHIYYSDPESPFEKIFLNISGSFCRDITAAYHLADRHFFDGGGMRSLFERILRILRSARSDANMQSALQGVFIEILSRLSMAQAGTTQNPEALALKSHLDSNSSHIVTVEELAGVIFRSKDYCTKLFLREFGATPYAYQLSRKMEIAKSLLINTRMSIEEIAVSLGYNDPHYFSNLFQKKCGCRPSSYKRQVSGTS